MERAIFVDEYDKLFDRKRLGAKRAAFVICEIENAKKI